MNRSSKHTVFGGSFLTRLGPGMQLPRVKVYANAKSCEINIQQGADVALLADPCCSLTRADNGILVAACGPPREALASTEAT